MFTRIWRFCPAPGALQDFVRVYGPDGDWAKLFGPGDGYLGTELRPLEDGSGDYLTVDRWASEEAWDAFRTEHSSEYEALDLRCEGLTGAESLVSEGTSAD
jgi:heme-degrading monooxygenase HmoA